MENFNKKIIAETEIRTELIRIGCVEILKDILAYPIKTDTLCKKIEPYFCALKDAENTLAYIKKLYEDNQEIEEQKLVESGETGPF